ncbi:MAG TPA: efflux RND transporter periplasmic adaptor subunit, partial [Pirellulaceae bacterium]|nr:efflux RND transporter periplasmic adaptor subunit [Pirellulaceae bacterium]
MSAGSGAPGGGGPARGPQGAGGDPTGQRAVPAGEVALQSKGYIIPAHQILVSPQVSGRLIKLFVEEGRTVEKGTLLGEIESTEFSADVARAKATLELTRQRLLELESGNRPEEIDQAKADLAEAETQLVQLEAEYRRGAQLVQSKVITTQDYELIESKYRSMQKRVDRWKAAVKLATDGPRKERIESARAEMQQAEADLIKAKWRLDNCRILAPISGTILKKNAEEGNIVNPIAFNGSFSVCDIADLADLEVSLDISERDVSLVFPDQRCQVRTEAFPNRLYEGWVSRLMPIADRAKGAIPVRVKLSVPKIEQGVYLKPEMGALVSFISGKPRDKGAEKAADAPRDGGPPTTGDAAANATATKPLADDADSGTKTTKSSEQQK